VPELPPTSPPPPSSPSTSASLQLLAPSLPTPNPSPLQLQRELGQCHQDIENLPVSQSEEEKPHFLFTLREVLLRGGEIGFVNAALTRYEV
jgi:hypothetical protein